MAKIGSSKKEHPKLGLGCWTFGGSQWGGQDDKKSMEAMARAYDLGISHFDTASGYGGGHSEELVGAFITDKRDRIFLASKQAANASKDKFMSAIDKSLARMQTDYIDLYYIHWPKSDIDMRPTMEALMKAKEKKKVLAVGVSNFSIEHMEQVSEVGSVDAHQLCYNLLWRWDEKDIIPYCVKNNIAVVTYSSIAQGILTGKFSQHPEFKEGDQRPSTVLFDQSVWPQVYDATEKMKRIAERAGRPLAHLAIRWVDSRKDVSSILVGVRDAEQVEQNAAAMDGDIPKKILDELTGISDEAMQKIPDTGNIFRYYP